MRDAILNSAIAMAAVFATIIVFSVRVHTDYSAHTNETTDVSGWAVSYTPPWRFLMDYPRGPHSSIGRRTANGETVWTRTTPGIRMEKFSATGEFAPMEPVRVLPMVTPS